MYKFSSNDSQEIKPTEVFRDREGGVAFTTCQYSASVGIFCMKKKYGTGKYAIRERKYRGSMGGFLRRLYKNQRTNSKSRGHLPPSYPFEWLYNMAVNDKRFVSMYKEYVDSGFDRRLAPSFDRIDDNLPYAEDNIQLMTFRENQQKAFRDQRAGKIINRTNPQRAVVKLSKSGEFIAEYVSTQEANRQTGIFQQNISKVCSGKRNFAGGYRWVYAEDYYD